MGRKTASSYLDTIGSGYDAQGYDGEQVGKAHQEEVAPADNWKDDKRDLIGRAANITMKKRRLARKIRRIAAELETLEDEKMDQEYKDEIEEMTDDIEEKQDDLPEELQNEEPEDLEKMTDEELAEIQSASPMDVEMGTSPLYNKANKKKADDAEEIENVEEKDDDDDFEIVESSLKVSDHPLTHDPAGDDPAANAPSQTGDDEWINIGPGTFEDKRDPANRAAKKMKK